MKGTKIKMEKDFNRPEKKVFSPEKNYLYGRIVSVVTVDGPAVLAIISAWNMVVNLLKF